MNRNVSSHTQREILDCVIGERNLEVDNMRHISNLERICRIEICEIDTVEDHRVRRIRIRVLDSTDVT